MPDVAERVAQSHGSDCAEDDVHAMYVELVPIQEPYSTDSAQSSGTLEAGGGDPRPRLQHRLHHRLSPLGRRYRRGQRGDAGIRTDVMVCADEVPAGRPEPWMLLRAMERLRVFPPCHVVKVGDTDATSPKDSTAGHGPSASPAPVTTSGLGHTRTRCAHPSEQRRLIDHAADVLRSAGAHYLIGSIASCRRYSIQSRYR